MVLSLECLRKVVLCLDLGGICVYGGGQVRGLTGTRPRAGKSYELYRRDPPVSELFPANKTTARNKNLQVAGFSVKKKKRKIVKTGYGLFIQNIVSPELVRSWYKLSPARGEGGAYVAILWYG